MKTSKICHFSRNNMHKEFQCYSVMVKQNFFFIKDSTEKLLSDSQLVTAFAIYSLSAIVIFRSNINIQLAVTHKKNVHVLHFRGCVFFCILGFPKLYIFFELK